MTRHLFVYGTLLPDETPRELSQTVSKLRKIGAGRTRGYLYDFGEYPGAVLGRSGGETISGIVYELPPNPGVLQELDAYEGFDTVHPENSLFIRKRRFVTLHNGRKLLSWVYEYNGDPSIGTQIPSGRYVRSKSEKSVRMAGD